MLYVTVIFWAFSLIVLVRNPKHPTSYYLCLSIAGWSLSFFGFLRYLANLDLSYVLVRYFFYVPSELWTSLVSSRSNIIVSIRWMNLGVALFIVFTFLYIRNVFGGPPRRARSFLLLAPALAEVLLYDPVFIRALSLALGDAQAIDAAYASAHLFSRLYNLAILVVPSADLIHRLYRHRRIPVVRYFYLFNTLGLTLLIAVFILSFNWAPAALARVYPGTSYLIFDLPAYIPEQVFYATYPYLSAASFSVVLVTLFRYKSLDRILGGKNRRYDRAGRLDNLGARALSHSLKNRLLAIRFEAEALLDGRASEGGEPAEGGAKERDAAGLRSIVTLADEAVASLNDFHRKVQRRDVLLEQSAMHELVESYAARRRASLPDHIGLECRIGRGDVKALVDKAHVEDCLDVLIQNSVDAIGARRGTIEISTELSGLWFIVSVRDDGPGIPPELLEHVGEPFFTTKPSATNWGIGLSYARRVANLHHGNLTIASQYGAGTTARLFLPTFV